MKKYLVVLLSLIPLLSFGQRIFRPHVINNKYEVVDSLPLERINIHSPFDYEDDKIIKMGEGNYLIEMPHKDKFVICRNFDRTKAIVVYNSYCFGRHKEFTIKEDDRRLILWYEDNYLYCGYVYDKSFKVCTYFEQKY